MMNGEFVLDCLEYLDADLITAAGTEAPRRRSGWIRWAAAAACFCLFVGGCLLLRGRKASTEGAQKWSPSMSAADYFLNCDNGEGPKRRSLTDLVMPPYAAALPLDGERECLETAGVLPPMEDHTGQDFKAYYNADGSLYKVTFWWMLRPYDDTGGYSDLRLTAAPKELHEISDVVVIRLDENGREVQPNVTLTLRDGVEIRAEGGGVEHRTLTWQTEEGWYQLYGDADREEELVALLDWFWAHPLSLERFRNMAEQCFVITSRAEQPEAFQAQIPDFKAMGYTAESELVYLAPRYDSGEQVPVGFVGVYFREETRVCWSLSLGADKDAFNASLGSPKEVREWKLTETLSEKNYVNIELLGSDLSCMATLRLEQGTAADAWEILQSMAR